MNPFHLLREKLSQAYYRARYWRPVWESWLNRRARRLAAAGQPFRFDAVSHRLLWDLRRDGIAFAHITEFAGGKEAFEAMQNYTKDRLADPLVAQEIREHDEILRTRVGSGGEKRAGKFTKDFLVNLWHENAGGKFGFDPSNPFLQFLTSDGIISTVTAYLGLAPRFNSLSFFSTLVVPPDSPAYLSQRWHRDPEDRKIVKVFLYMNDVNETGAGPFTYVLQSHPGGKWRFLFPQRPPAGVYPQPGAVEWNVAPSDIKTCLAPAGTLIFCDTSGLHRGGFSTTKNRIMFTVCYCSDASLQPINYERPADAALASLPALARLALRP